MKFSIGVRYGRTPRINNPCSAFSIIVILVDVRLLSVIRYMHQQNVRKVSSGFEYSLLTFAHIPVLILKSLEQYAELNSLSNGGIFRVGHRTKPKGLVRNTRFLGFSSHYSLLTFAHTPLLILKPLE